MFHSIVSLYRNALLVVFLTLISLLNASKEAQASSNTRQFEELNIGIALDVYGSGIPMPGASLLRGASVTSGPFFVELSGGLALPTLVTVKLGAGLCNKEYFKLGLSVRAWPFSYGPQIEFGNGNNSLIISYEHWHATGQLVTAGYRWKM